VQFNLFNLHFIFCRSMKTFTRPKLFRSTEGCCICKAKSSSSRFTDSIKYEEDFSDCFKTREERVGEICNACVLVVKRWRKLPRQSSKDWSHIVDSKAGPGNKGSAKKKTDKSCFSEEKLHKISRKQLTKPRSSRKLKFAAINPSEEQLKNRRKSSLPKKLSPLESHQYSEVYDSTYWSRRSSCCGTVYLGRLGEMMVKKDDLTDCNRPTKKENISSFVEMELEKLNQKQIVDEGFCDKLSSGVSTNPSSPESIRTSYTDDL